MAYWKPPSGLLAPQSIRAFKGVYRNDDDGFSFAEGFAQDMRNISSQSFPALSNRPGFFRLGANLAGRVTGLGVWLNTQLHAIANGTWNRYTGTAWEVITGGTGLNTTADASFANFKGNLAAVNLIMANGVDPVKRYDGLTVQNLTGAPANAKYIEQHDNRLYAATKDDSGKYTRIKFSALSKADDWTTAKDAGELVVETNNGEEIIGLRGGNQHLTVFKKSSMHELFGTGPSNYRLIEVANDIGAYSNKAITTVSGSMYFISNRIYQYSGGSRPDWNFAKPIQNYINGMNLLAANKCVAGNNGRNVYFAIPYGSQAFECNMVLEYDTAYDVWYVWDNLSLTQFARMNSDWFSGDFAGNVFKMGEGTADNGSPLRWSWVSPPYGAGTLAKRTNWYNMWVAVDLPAGSTLTVSLSKLSSGDSDWTVVKTVSSSGGFQNARVIIPLNMVAMSNFIRVKFEGSGPFRMFEFDRQMREMPIK